MSDRTEIIRKRYDRIAKVYDCLESLMESAKLSDYRKEAISELEGKVLEVGIGTGKNIPYYPDHLEVTGIDFSKNMLEIAKKKAYSLDKKIKLIQMDAQNMKFQDNSFDSVITTCVFCSIPDPIMGLKEIRRVCRKNGKIIMIEHVRSEKKLLGILMDIFNPLIVGLYGANINRKTVNNLSKVGFSDIKVTNIWLDVFKIIKITNTK